jgi:hypothetical protein
VEAGNRAGCKTILIDNGNETEWVGGEMRTPAYIVKNLREVAARVLNEQRTAPIEKGGANERAIEKLGRRV